MGTSLVNGLNACTSSGDRPRASILRWGSRFTAPTRRGYGKRILVPADNAQSLLAERFDSAEGSFLDKTLYTDLHTYLPGDLLVKSDRMAMALLD